MTYITQLSDNMSKELDDYLSKLNNKLENEKTNNNDNLIISNDELSNEEEFMYEFS